jgi:hypothetical protein
MYTGASSVKVSPIPHCIISMIYIIVTATVLKQLILCYQLDGYDKISMTLQMRVHRILSLFYYYLMDNIRND